MKHFFSKLIFQPLGVSIGLSLVGVGLGGAALADNLMDTVDNVPEETPDLDTLNIGNKDDGISEEPVDESLDDTVPACK